MSRVCVCVCARVNVCGPRSGPLRAPPRAVSRCSSRGALHALGCMPPLARSSRSSAGLRPAERDVISWATSDTGGHGISMAMDIAEVFVSSFDA